MTSLCFMQIQLFPVALQMHFPTGWCPASSPIRHQTSAISQMANSFRQPIESMYAKCLRQQYSTTTCQKMQIYTKAEVINRRQQQLHFIIFPMSSISSIADKYSFLFKCNYNFARTKAAYRKVLLNDTCITCFCSQQLLSNLAFSSKSTCMLRNFNESVQKDFTIRWKHL